MANRKNPIDDSINSFTEGFLGKDYEGAIDRLLRSFYSINDKARAVSNDPWASLFGANPELSADPLTSAIRAGVGSAVSEKVRSPGEWFHSPTPEQKAQSRAQEMSWMEDMKSKDDIITALNRLGNQSKKSAKKDQFVMRGNRGGNGSDGVYGTGGQRLPQPEAPGQFTRVGPTVAPHPRDVLINEVVKTLSSLPDGAFHPPSSPKWGGPIMDVLRKLGIEE